MRKLSEIKGEDALDVLAEIIEPVSEIANDQVFIAYIRSGKKVPAIRLAIRDHKKAILTIMANLEGEDPKTYSPSLIKLPMLLLELLNDPELALLFQQEQTVTTSGSATGNTVETEEA